MNSNIDISITMKFTQAELDTLRAEIETMIKEQMGQLGLTQEEINTIIDLSIIEVQKSQSFKATLTRQNG